MFKVKAKLEYKTFKVGDKGTVIAIHNDANSLPLLLVADNKGDMSWCEAEFFSYLEKAQPVNKGGRPKKSPGK